MSISLKRCFKLISRKHFDLQNQRYEKFVRFKCKTQIKSINIFETKSSKLSFSYRVTVTERKAFTATRRIITIISTKFEIVFNTVWGEILKY